MGKKDARRVSVFLYGLLMDEVRVRSLGAFPANVRAASVEGFALQLGPDPTLVPKPRSKTYGLVMDLTHAEIDKLHHEMGKRLFRAEAVTAHVQDGKEVSALCFNAPAPQPGPPAPGYAENLRDLSSWLGLPVSYLR